MNGSNLHNDVNPIQHGAGNPTLVVLHRLLGTLAAAAGISVPAALAGIHGADHHKFRGIGGGARHPGNGHLSVLQGLTHQIQRILPKLRQLVQEQNSLMGKADLAGLRIAAAAHQTRIGNRMVGRPEGPPCDQGIFGRKHSHYGINLTDLQGFLPGHIRQNRRKPFGKHTLSRTRRADQQHIVAACRRNLQRPLYVLLTQHIPKVRFRLPGLLRHPQGLRLQLRQSVQALCQLCHGVNRDYLRSPGQGGLRRVFRRNIELTNPRLFGGQGHRQHTGYAPDHSVQADLPQKGAVLSGRPHLPGSRQNAQKDGQVIMSTRLLLAGRGQIHRNAADRKFQMAALHRRPDPLPGLLHGGIRQANDLKAGQSVGDKTLAGNRAAADAGNA